MAYKADIEIAVRGARQLKDLQNEILRTNDAISDINSRLNSVANLTVKNFNNLYATLSDARQAFNEAARGTDAFGSSIETLIRAEREYNDELRERNNLLKQARAEQLAAGRVVRPGPTGFTSAQMSPALPPSMRRVGTVSTSWGAALEKLEEVAQDLAAVTEARKSNTKMSWGLALGALEDTAAELTSSAMQRKTTTSMNWNLALETLNDVAAELASATTQRTNNTKMNWNLALNQFNDIAKDLNKSASIKRTNIQTSWDLFFKEAAEIANELQQKAARVSLRSQERDIFVQETISRGRSARIARERSEFLLGTSGSEVLGPERGFRTAAGARAATGFQIALPETNLDREVAQRERINSLIDDQITFNQKISEGLQRQRAVGLDINNLEKSDTRLIQQQGILKQRELRTEEALKKAIKKNAALRRAQENALIGGAFPLLFGQGLGASAGGALGGFFGGKAGGQLGFGLSLVGTAIGQAFDDATRRVTEMGNALRTLDLSTLEQSAIRISEELKFQVEKLKESGNFARARALVEQTVAQQTGSTATVIKDIANSGNLLKAAFDEVVASGSVLLGSVAAPLAAALAGVLKVVAEIFKFINRIIAAVGGLLRTVENIIDPARNIQKAIESIAPAAAEATAEMKKLADETLRALGLTQQTADLNLKLARIGPSNSAENKIARRRVELEKEKLRIGERIDVQLRKALKLSGQDRIEAVRKLKLLEATYLREADLNAARDIAIINMREQLRLNKENLDIENRRAEAVKRRLQDAQAVLTAVIQANQAEKRVEDFILPDPTPFSKFSNKEIRDQTISRIEKERDNQLLLLRQRGLKEELRLEKERTIIAEANLAIKQANADFVNKERTEQERAIKATVEANANLDKQIALIQAKLNGTQEEVRLNQELNGIVKSIGSISLEEIETLQRKLELLRDIRKVEAQFDIQQQTRFAGAGLQAGFIGQAGQAFEKTLIDGGTMEEANKLAQLTQEMVIAQTQAQALESAVLGIGNAFATAMTTGVSELIAGTKSAEEVFADFLKNVGDALINAAAQMIATYIAIGIAKAFAGLSGGGEAINTESLNQIESYSGVGASTDVSSFAGAFRANGGPVNRNTTYMVGENGPELFRPTQAGRIDSNSDLRSAMSRQQ